MIGWPFDSIVTTGSNGEPVYDRAISSDPFRKLLKNLFSTGILPTTASPTNMQVTTDEGLRVKVKAGFAIVEGCMKLEEADTTLGLPINTSDLPRIYTIALRLNANVEVRTCEYIVLQGTPASNPIAPELTRTSTIYDIGLANVLIPANAGQSTPISASAITDTRYDDSRCGVISPIAEFSTEQIYQQVQSDLAGFKAEEQAQFIAWFQNIRDILDESTAGHLQNQIDELKNSVGNSKTLLADAITTKRVPTSATDTFAQMASNIEAITLGSGNAVRADVLSGKTFTNDDGIEYTGTMPQRNAGQTGRASDDTLGWDGASVYVRFLSGYYPQSGAKEGYTYAYANKSDLGNASAVDVVSGKTFTSQNGLKLSGTYSPSLKLGQGVSDGAYGSSRSITTNKAYKSAIIVVATGYSGFTSGGTAPSVSSNGGTLTSLVRKVNLYGNSGHGFAVYKAENVPNGATITVNFGGGNGYAGYGQTVYIIENE